MLVLSRKCGEKIVISEEQIVITVLEVRGDRIRFGIDAPAHISVHREEVWKQIKRSRASTGASTTEPDPEVA